MTDGRVRFDLKVGSVTVIGLTSDHLKSLASAGRLDCNDQIKRTSGTRWQEAGSVPGLAELLAQSGDRDQPENHEIEAWIVSSINEFTDEVSVVRTDLAATWVFAINVIEMRAHLLPAYFIVSANLAKLSGRQLDDSRLLERLLRVAGDMPGVSIGIDSDDVMIVRSARGRDDLDKSEVRECILSVAATLEELSERVAHLL